MYQRLMHPVEINVTVIAIRVIFLVVWWIFLIPLEDMDKEFISQSQFFFNALPLYGREKAPEEHSLFWINNHCWMTIQQ